jgi:hypothetical protein
MQTGEGGALIVRSTIDLAHNLGLGVVACDEAQAPPQPAAAGGRFLGLACAAGLNLGAAVTQVRAPLASTPTPCLPAPARPAPPPAA